MHQNSGSPFPTEPQQFLLQAALLSGNDMLLALQKWRELVDFETDIRFASFRMLPLLYQNLHQHNIDDPIMPRLKGIYRKAWSNNHILFHKAAAVLRYLQNEGIQTIILKGIALTTLVYKNFGVRPMADMDILVPLSQATKSIALLKNDGWIAQNEQYLEYNLKYGRSITFCDIKNTELDLHWHPIFEAHDNITENDFWKFAIPLEVAGVKTLAFGITDTLFHTIVHGMRYNPEPPIRWVADATMLINNEPDKIDWDRIIHHSKKFRVFLQMKSSLNYLKDAFHVQVPENVLSELENIKPSFSDRLVYRHAKKYGDQIPITFYEKLYSIYAGYLRQSSEERLWSQHIGFIKYLRFRTKGKPYFRIIMYYLSLLFKKPNR
nr:nucleotidyltransferase family protein [Bacteroidota bacterium]